MKIGSIVIHCHDFDRTVAFWQAALQELLSSYESSPGKFRRFCSRCGSHVIAERVNQPNVLLRLGCLDTPMPDRAKAHIWCSDGATWFDPKDVAPEFAEGVVTQQR